MTRTLPTVRIATASSIDGRTFTFSTTGDAPIVAGDLVSMTPEGTERLVGLILDRQERGGRGVLLAGETREFADIEVVAASPDDAQRVFGDPDLIVGEFRARGAPIPASLDGSAFNRHTFLCGQSGSGKTYTLGAILERILAGTTLPMVILDPNADFVGLGSVRDDADGPEAERLRALSPGVQAAGIGRAEAPLRLRYTDLTREVAAAAVRLDPVADRDEFNAIFRLERPAEANPDGVLREMRASGDPTLAALAVRFENLGVLEWDIWAWGKPSVLDGLGDRGRRATVLDLSGARSSAERSTAALAVLDHLWSHREERRPTLIVIDEAHNVCSANPSDAVQALATERLIDIAAEGRKYGLWLFLSTQRPSKIHPQVLSQCDNLVVMRMNSPGDLAHLGDVFGFAPPALLAQAPTFRKGEALLAGGFVPVPMVVRVGRRFTTEGGIDVPVPR